MVRPLVRAEFSPYASLSDREGFRINLLVVRYPQGCETPMGHDRGVLSFDGQINDRELFWRGWVRMGHLACKHLGDIPDFA
jgi:hypothetical protein